MLDAPGILLTALVVAAAPLAAQTPADPNLVFSISAGLTRGGALWSLDRQQAPAPGGEVDTLALGRRLRPGLTATVGAAYYRSRHFGYTAEMGYFGVGSESRCTPVVPYKPDAENLNQQACTRAQGGHVPTSAVGVLGGATIRFTPPMFAQPYVRAGFGLAIYGNSFVQTSGDVVGPSCTSPDGVCRRFFLDESKRREMGWLAVLAAGASVPINRAYRAHIEVRDLVTALPEVTGPAPLTSVRPVPPTTTRTRHVLVLTAGFDIVLERRRGRRY